MELMGIDESNLPLLFVKAWLGQALNYFVVVGLVFLLVWKVSARLLASRRIPTRFAFDGAQVVREIANTMVTLGIGTVSAVIILVLYQRGQTSLSPGDDWPLWQSVAAFAGLIVFNDTWFYWWHRLLHHPKVFKHIHSVHHRSVDVNPFTSYSFHAVEGYLLGAWSLPMALFVPMSFKVLAAAQVVGLLNNVVSHLGYELLPKWWVRAPLVKWTSSATYHSLHHSVFTGNYGLMFRFWDRVMGTEVKDYERAFVQRGEGQTGSTTQTADGNHQREPSQTTEKELVP